jgi:hypothetical protein
VRAIMLEEAQTRPDVVRGFELAGNQTDIFGV